jgi:hypothetical protein
MTRSGRLNRGASPLGLPDTLSRNARSRLNDCQVRERASRLAICLAVLVLAHRGLAAHDGPPFPIVSNQISGPYAISVWTDPDTTDDGTPGGQFWVTLEPAGSVKTVAAGTIATVSIRPLDRNGPPRDGQAAPMAGNVARQFVALVMDHEGRFAVRVTVDGPGGRGQVEAQVDATYDLRPALGLVFLYLLPFVALGGLWVKLLLRRHRGLKRDLESRPR